METPRLSIPEFRISAVRLSKVDQPTLQIHMHCKDSKGTSHAGAVWFPARKHKPTDGYSRRRETTAGSGSSLPSRTRRAADIPGTRGEIQALEGNWCPHGVRLISHLMCGWMRAAANGISAQPRPAWNEGDVLLDAGRGNSMQKCGLTFRVSRICDEAGVQYHFCIPGPFPLGPRGILYVLHFEW